MVAQAELLLVLLRDTGQEVDPFGLVCHLDLVKGPMVLCNALVVH